MERIARAVTPGLVSVALIALGGLLVVVAVGGSPLPWYAAVAVAAAELLGAGYLVGRNAALVEAVPAKAPGRPAVVKAA